MSKTEKQTNKQNTTMENLPILIVEKNEKKS